MVRNQQSVNSPDCKKINEIKLNLVFMMKEWKIFGLPLPQAISLLTFLVAIISIWIHMEIRLAEINVELSNLKQDLIFHKADNSRDLENLRTDIKSDTREILKKIDEIQIYLRNK